MSIRDVERAATTGTVEEEAHDRIATDSAEGG